MVLKPIGVVHSNYRTAREAPFQGRLAEETAVLEVFPEFAGGLKDIDQATHLIVLYWCHQADRGMAVLITAHDLAAACYVAHRLVFLAGGGIVDEGPSAGLIAAPAHPVTRDLLRAAGAEAAKAGVFRG